MTSQERWLLPPGIDEILPPQAARMERLRRAILDLFQSWGYELVIPPLIEYLESLLTGMGTDLDLETFKLTDQLTGRLMGVRADMTPQVARIDAHRLQRDVPTRLCYLGPVLLTRPRGVDGTRNPMQLGAELYGYAGVESDLEILRLMVETLKLVATETLYVDLGNVDIFRGLVRQAGVNSEQERELFDALQRKEAPAVKALLKSIGAHRDNVEMFRTLCELNGDKAVLIEAKKALAKAPSPVHKALDRLMTAADALEQTVPGVDWHVDLAELRGYHYHTGIVFAAYAIGSGQALARGGRYDEVGGVFGRARPAIGFTIDLKKLVTLLPGNDDPAAGILAPWSNDPHLSEAICALRTQGERVVYDLPDCDHHPSDLGCNRTLALESGHWVVTVV